MFAPPGVFAQPDAAARIAFGDRVTGQLGSETPRARFAFDGLRGDLITLAVEVTGSLDPTLTLLGPAAPGAETAALIPLAFRDDAARFAAESGGSPAGVRLASFRLPASGTYLAVVGRFGDALGTTEGAFTLTLDRVGASAADGSTLRDGDAVINTISDSSPQRFYSVRAQAGESLTVRMARMSGSLDALLTLTDAAGVVLAENDDAPGSENALDAGIIAFTIPADGQYIIIASRFGGPAGRSAGTFVLSVSTTPEGGRGASPEAALPIAPGSPVSARIDDARTTWIYAFTAEAGAVVSARLVRQSGDLDPVLTLADAAGTALIVNDDAEGSQNSAILGYPLPTAGRYLLIATRYAGTDAPPTAGDFLLTLTEGDVPGGTPPESTPP
jgi:hypothetical protein